MAETSLVTQWAVCGIAAAAARFVPVPLLDDVVRQRATQVAVARTLQAHGRGYPSTAVEPLWGDPEGAPRGVRKHLRGLGRRLLLFPVRKYAAVFGAVRGVPTDVMRLVLLARTLDRQLERGALQQGQDLTGQARGLRRAVDQAIEGMDLRLLTAALSDGLSGTRGLSGAAVALARRRFAAKDPDVEAPVPAEGAVATGAEQVTGVLRRPEVVRLLEDFDRRVDPLLPPAA